jgi:uncharacterized RDD family membrane protein YckC
MNWHYVEGSESRGPVTDAELDALISAGSVGPDTLIWREGMAEWLPCSQVKGTAFAAPPGQVLCAECGRPFPPEDVIRHGDQFICSACKPVFLQKLKEGVTPVAALRYAGFWIRVLAYIIDFILMEIVLVPLSIAIRFAAGGTASPMDPNIPAFLANSTVSIVLVVSYYTFFVGKYGATPGKMALKLRVVNPDGSPVSYGKACGRYFAFVVSSMACLIGLLMVAWDSEKRGLHDRMCNTRVIQIKS